MTTVVKTRKTKIRQSVVSQVFDVANYALLVLLGVATLGPFIWLIFGSITETSYYLSTGVSLTPEHWSLDAYKVLLGGASRIYRSFQVTIFMTLVGTLLSLLVTAALAYGISKKNLPGHNLFVSMIFFTMMFSGGIVPFYLIVKILGLVDTIWALIFPFLVSAWNMFIMVKFFESLPSELEDAARIDGCSEFTIFFRIVLPLSKPVLATVGLFYGVSYWNQWFWATIFLVDSSLHPLQLVLRDILSQMIQIQDPNAAVDAAKNRIENMPPVEVMRMGAILVTVVPIALVYPFLQKYFVKGVMIGAIKG
jgi:putative aldouronate transport system permease protein